MPATPERAAFVAQQYRSATWQSQQVKDLYGRVARDTTDEPYESFFDDPNDAQKMLNERALLIGSHARRFRTTIGKVLLESDIDLSEAVPSATIIDDNLVANMTAAIVAVESIDLEEERTVLNLWGVIGAPPYSVAEGVGLATGTGDADGTGQSIATAEGVGAASGTGSASAAGIDGSAPVISAAAGSAAATSGSVGPGGSIAGGAGSSIGTGPGSATGVDAGGGVNDYRVTAGFGLWSGSDTTTFMRLAQVTTAADGDGVFDKMHMGIQATATAGLKIKALIYADSGGSPGPLIAASNEHTVPTHSANYDAEFTFASSVTVAASTAYWIGYICDGNLGYIGSGSGSVYAQAATYASGPPNPASGGSISAHSCPSIYFTVQNANSPGGTGFIAHSGGSSNSLRRIALPAFAVDDIVLLHIINLGSPAPTISLDASYGFTQIDNAAMAATSVYQSAFYVRRMDGSEPGYITIGAPGTDTFFCNAAVIRGVTTGATFYEGAGTQTANSATALGTAVTTTGANRLIVNLYEQENSTSDTPDIDVVGFTDMYDLHSTVGTTDASLYASYLLKASAGTVAAERRTIAASKRWRSHTLALIMA